eukprot:TRINITY_DN1877_c0_g2_i3.p1 TRINITY_DN1877_c0_g2~~TRINITY_DN1877_c0_g2_i3.p1  ORF type:complete len:326 (-),score=94.55 TRINITY_DN1877_c0_g2_i3:123-1100(-)
MCIRDRKKAMETRNSLRNFEVENSIVSAETAFGYDEQYHHVMGEEQPWTKDPVYFKRVKVSMVALLKMITHAHSGGDIEVMGSLQGKVVGDTFFIQDAIRLPVEGTETRVNAGAEAMEFLTQYIEIGENAGRKEAIVGWYHSHPNYGCWLSGIDVSTQRLQQHQEPFVAIVVDPIQTLSLERVQIGAFRTYPTNYKPTEEQIQAKGNIPKDKISDFGAHHKDEADSKLIETLWAQYWKESLAASLVVRDAEKFHDGCCGLSRRVKSYTDTIKSGRPIVSADDLIARNDPSRKAEFVSFGIEKNGAALKDVFKTLLFLILRVKWFG